MTSPLLTKRGSSNVSGTMKTSSSDRMACEQKETSRDVSRTSPSPLNNCIGNMKDENVRCGKMKGRMVREERYKSKTYVALINHCLPISTRLTKAMGTSKILLARAVIRSNFSSLSESKMRYSFNTINRATSFSIDSGALVFGSRLGVCQSQQIDVTLPSITQDFI